MTEISRGAGRPLLGEKPLTNAEIKKRQKARMLSRGLKGVHVYLPITLLNRVRDYARFNNKTIQNSIETLLNEALKDFTGVVDANEIFNQPSASAESENK